MDAYRRDLGDLGGEIWLVVSCRLERLGWSWSAAGYRVREQVGIERDVQVAHCTREQLTLCRLVSSWPTVALDDVLGIGVL